MQINDECEFGNFTWEEESFCEHCGDLSPLEIMWCDGGTWWCLGCAVLNDDFKITETFTKKMINKWKEDYEDYLKEELDNISMRAKGIYKLLTEKE